MVAAALPAVGVVRYRALASNVASLAVARRLKVRAVRSELPLSSYDWMMPNNVGRSRAAATVLRTSAHATCPDLLEGAFGGHVRARDAGPTVSRGLGDFDRVTLPADCDELRDLVIADDARS
ncbi:MAG: hypothetical protein R2699_00255 [Acidimicrobiales bacterium]